MIRGSKLFVFSPAGNVSGAITDLIHVAEFVPRLVDECFDPRAFALVRLHAAGEEAQSLEYAGRGRLAGAVCGAAAMRRDVRVEPGAKRGERNQAMEDIYWVLINGSEFSWNH